MKYFNIEWMHSQPSLDPWDVYKPRLEMVRQRVDAASAAFLGTYALHDARVEKVVVVRAEPWTVALEVAAGDEHVGYVAARIVMSGVANFDECANFFRRLRKRVVEINHEEFDVAAEGRFVLRLWFFNGGSIDILAGTLAIEEVRPLARRERGGLTCEISRLKRTAPASARQRRLDQRQ